MVATQKEAACRIDVRDPHSFDTIVMLAAQYSSVAEFRNKMEDLLEEHEAAAKKEFGIDPASFMKQAPKRKTVKGKE
jgi:hypothetical protein